MGLDQRSKPSASASRSAHAGLSAEQRAKRSKKNYTSGEEEDDILLPGDDFDEEDGVEEDVEEVIRPSSSSRSSSTRSGVRRVVRRSSSVDLPGQVSFVQLLVFLTVMLQALTLFVTYHMLLSTQYSESTMTNASAQVAHIHTNMVELRTKLEEYNTQLETISEQVTYLGQNGIAMSNSNNNNNDDSNNDSNNDESNESSSEEESNDSDSTESDAAEEPKLSDEELDRQIFSPRTADKSGGNRLMALLPDDAATLHKYRNWTDDSAGVAYDAGAGWNQTHHIMKLLGQYDTTNGVWKDIEIIERVRDDRTTISARDIKKGEYFFKIHQDYLLTSIVVEHSQIGKELTRTGYEVDEMVWMSVFILYEKHMPNSYWKFWLNILPTSYRHMGVTYDWHNELELIEGTMANQWIADYQVQYRREYVGLALHLRALDFSQFSFSQYVWARCAVASRAFGLDVWRSKKVSDDELAVLKKAGKTPETELVHITCMSAADLINHQGEHRKIDAIWGWNEKTHQFAFKAVRDIPANTVIHTTYGPRGNSDLFAHYGFTLPYNPFNSAQLCVAASESDPLFDGKQKMLEEVYGNGDRVSEWDACGVKLPDHPIGYRCRFHMDVMLESVQECFQFARIAVSDAESFNDALLPPHETDLKEKEAKVATGEDPQESTWSVLQIEPFDFEVEVKAMEFIGDFAALALRKIAGGSVAQDTAILDAHKKAQSSGVCDDKNASVNWFPVGPCLTYQQSSLLWVRHGEKSVLEGAVSLALHVSGFGHARPKTVEEAYAYLGRIVYTPEQLEFFKTENITPEYSHLRYFNEVFLPLYFTHNKWDVDISDDDETKSSPLAIQNAELYKKYKAIYNPPEDNEGDDDENEFEFTQP